MADKETKDDGDFLSTWRTRFEACVDFELKPREKALEDRKFARGRLEDQWPQDVIDARRAAGQPCHIINRMPVILRAVTNAQRQNRASGKVSPVDDKGDIKVAEVLMGGIRHIEYISKADVVYGTAGFNAALSGVGYILVVPQYCDPQTFEQEIRLMRVRNPFSIYLDPNSQEPDGSDARYGFKVTTLTREEFEQDYPKKKIPSADEWEVYQGKYQGWYTTDGQTQNVRILEVFYQDLTDDTLYMLKSGQVVLGSQLKEAPAANTVAQKRATQIPVIKWCKMTAMEKLEETKLPGSGKWLPIVKVVGEEIDVNGEVETSGVIRHAKDAQREFNYMRSARTKAIGLAPTAPWVMAEGQEEGHEDAFKTANLVDPPYLLYKATDVGGQLAPPPQRQTAEPPVQALTIACRDASDDMKATTGVYDAQQGAVSNETSGRAINARVNQGETSNYHLIDNLTISIGHTARIILDWWKDIYDTKRTLRMIGEDGTHSVVTTVGSSVTDLERATMQIFGEDENPKATNKEPVYDVSVGTYDVVCEAGPSFATKRQQAAESLSALVQAHPEIMQWAGDLILKAFDFPYAQEMAERAKKLLPPQVQDNQDGAPEIPPEVQQKIAADQQQIAQLTESLNALSQQVETKAHDIAAKERMNTENNEVKKYIAELNATNTAAIADMQAHSDAALATLQAELQHLGARLAAQFAPAPEAVPPQGQQPQV